jgi:hypothetical protein
MALRILAQSNRTFDLTGALTMAELAFFNAATSDEIRTMQARTLALAMDNIFRQIDGAIFENGANPDVAIRDITDALVDAALTVAHLAERNDANYRFFAES